MTNGKRRRVMTVMLALCLLLIVVIGWQIWNSLRTDRAVEYSATNLTPTPAEVCPGDKFTFPVSISINHGNSIARITEGWCRADTGICPYNRQNDPYFINFVEPYSVTVQAASRTVPEDMPPGDWQLRHCNETHASGIIDVTCWQVQVTVKDCP